MKVCVLQPDYSTTDVDYKNYDPPRNLSNLLPGDKVEHVFLNKLHTYSQLKSLAKEGYDIFVNLCEGYLEWPVPSIEVPYFLELFQLPYTGPDCRVYDPAKQLMKYVAFTAGVRTPPFAILNSLSNIRDCIGHLSFPLFLKPAKAGDSLGIDEKSLVHDLNELTPKFVELLAEFGEVLIEEYIEGREFTVLVVADINGKDCDAYTPLEYIFSGKDKFKTYALKTRELHPEANVLCIDPLLKERLQTAAREIFIAFGGVGYARLDFRLNQGNQLYFLDINFTCSVFYTDGYEGSADYILKNDANGLDGFLKKVISEGISRYQRTLPLYKVQGSPVSGYGIYALRHILKNEIVFRGEGRSQRLISLKYVRENWTTKEEGLFKRYAYPVGKDIFLLWDDDPNKWAPQNHSCNPNTEFSGLNLLAIKDIRTGEEITVDYAKFLDRNMEPFECHCGAPNCRKWIEVQ